MPGFECDGGGLDLKSTMYNLAVLEEDLPDVFGGIRGPSGEEPNW